MTNPAIASIEPTYTGIAGAATYLSMSRSSIRRLIASGRLAATRLPTGSIRIRIADLESLGEPV